MEEFLKWATIGLQIYIGYFVLMFLLFAGILVWMLWKDR